MGKIVFIGIDLHLRPHDGWFIVSIMREHGNVRPYRTYDDECISVHSVRRAMRAQAQLLEKMKGNES